MNIAYWAVGDGPTLLHMPIIPLTHVQYEWETPGRADWYTALAANHRVVRYDPRGFGLSTHDPENLALEALVEDVPAVIEAVGGPVTLVSFGFGATLALAFANRYPDAVDGLVLRNPVQEPPGRG